MINKRISALAVALTLAVGGPLMMPQPAHAGAAVWGATEWTQIANNVQLVASYGKQVQQVITQIKQYEAQLKALRQLDPRKLEGMLKGMAGEMAGKEVLRQLKATEALDGTLQKLAKNIDTIHREGRTATEVYELLRSRGKNIKPGDYVGMIKALAEVRQDTYGERLKELNRAVEDAQSDIKRAEAIADLAPQIATDVEGFGALLQSNAVVVSQLGGLRQTLAAGQKMEIEAAAALAAQADRQKAADAHTKEWMERQFAPKRSQ